MGRLDGKVALITGGGTGLGTAFARHFVTEGAKVVITGRRKEKLEAVVNALPAGSVLAVAGDVSKPEDARAMVEDTVKFGGKIDVLVNNAGVDPAGTITEIPLEQWQEIININLNGTFYMTRFALQYMEKQGQGSIINISSLAALRAIPAMPAYIASKNAIHGLTLACALDYGRKGIRCNVICPGAVRTEMLEHSMGAFAKALNTDVSGALDTLTRFLPIAKAGLPDEVAGAAVFLASDESSYMTGSIMTIDGGACVVDPNGAAVASSGANWGA